MADDRIPTGSTDKNINPEKLERLRISVAPPTWLNSGTPRKSQETPIQPKPADTPPAVTGGQLIIPPAFLQKAVPSGTEAPTSPFPIKPNPLQAFRRLPEQTTTTTPPQETRPALPFFLQQGALRQGTFQPGAILPSPQNAGPLEGRERPVQKFLQSVLTRPGNGRPGENMVPGPKFLEGNQQRLGPAVEALGGLNIGNIINTLTQTKIDFNPREKSLSISGDFSKILESIPGLQQNESNKELRDLVSALKTLTLKDNRLTCFLSHPVKLAIEDPQAQKFGITHIQLGNETDKNGSIVNMELDVDKANPKKATIKNMSGISVIAMGFSVPIKQIDFDGSTEKPSLSATIANPLASYPATITIPIPMTDAQGKPNAAAQNIIKGLDVYAKLKQGIAEGDLTKVIPGANLGQVMQVLPPEMVNQLAPILDKLRKR